MDDPLRESRVLCRRITGRSGSTFRLGFGWLPRDQAEAMHALYAYCRLTDDIADGPGDGLLKRQQLTAWQTTFCEAMAGQVSGGIFPSLIDSVKRFSIRPDFLIDQIRGAEWDIDRTPIRTFDDLNVYCQLVASSVGMACLSIWGCRDPEAEAPARAAGVALQLTNILRDLGEDRQRGRVYIPEEEWKAHGCPPESWRADDPNFQKLMAVQAQRARDAFTRSKALIPMLTGRSRTVFRLFLARYRLVFDEIERRKFDTLHERVKPSRGRSLLAILKAFLMKGCF